ncbi:hypothetical protein TRFO_35302 [Tritrichomonas foetus]|uniref:Uncharacterized protein n=1 Tax=Tritrichomonas foetus TaxID=1144522 RepID=A0A1J4JHT0_9EUKA|nr:hypothetical protein TRFO_35302 [Tritrichomonas foetus]|eukprot:OHS98281.1 hypothetical protein TRFO_35302 [Tritrichomonas foetus]
MQTINQIINGNFEEFPHLQIFQMILNAAYLKEKTNGYKCYIKTMKFIYKIKDETDLKALNIDEEEKNTTFYNTAFINDSVIFPKNEIHDKIKEIGFKPFMIKYEININEFVPIDCVPVNSSRRFKIDSYKIQDIKNIYKYNIIDGNPFEDEENEIMCSFINLIDPTHPYKILSLEDKLNLVNDALEKDEMKKILDLYNTIYEVKFNPALIAIIKDYLGNVSENVQLHLQNEIREINEIMTGEGWGLLSYIHNL